MQHGKNLFNAKNSIWIASEMRKSNDIYEWNLLRLFPPEQTDNNLRQIEFVQPWILSLFTWMHALLACIAAYIYINIQVHVYFQFWFSIWMRRSPDKQLNLHPVPPTSIPIESLSEHHESFQVARPTIHTTHSAICCRSLSLMHSFWSKIMIIFKHWNGQALHVIRYCGQVERECASMHCRI